MAHLIEYEDIPRADKLYEDEIPIGALILAHQVVGCFLIHGHQLVML
jgi:hypothetical protein